MHESKSWLTSTHANYIEDLLVKIVWNNLVVLILDFFKIFFWFLFLFFFKANLLLILKLLSREAIFLQF